MNMVRKMLRLFRKRSLSIEELRLLATSLEREFHDYRDAQTSANARLEAGLSELVAANMAHTRVLSDLHGVFLKIAEAKRPSLDLSRAIVNSATDAELLVASGLFDEKQS